MSLEDDLKDAIDKLKQAMASLEATIATAIPHIGSAADTVAIQDVAARLGVLNTNLQAALNPTPVPVP